MRPWNCRGGEEGAEEGEAPKPISAARELWVRPQASAKCMRYLYNATSIEELLPGSLGGLAKPGQGLQGVSH